MAVIGINYEGGNTYDENDVEIENPIIYESVYLHYNISSGESTEKLFNTGNFVKDWYEANKFYNMELSDNDHLSHSSSADHFFMDGAKYDSGYLHMIDGVPVLKYLDRNDDNWIYTQRDIYEGWEVFVEEGTTPTWEQYKEYVKSFDINEQPA
jgi:hypothetical protein